MAWTIRIVTRSEPVTEPHIICTDARNKDKERYTYSIPAWQCHGQYLEDEEPSQDVTQISVQPRISDVKGHNSPTQTINDRAIVEQDRARCFGAIRIYHTKNGRFSKPIPKDTYDADDDYEYNGNVDIDCHPPDINGYASTKCRIQCRYPMVDVVST